MYICMNGFPVLRREKLSMTECRFTNSCSKRERFQRKERKKNFHWGWEQKRHFLLLLVVDQTSSSVGWDTLLVKLIGIECMWMWFGMPGGQVRCDQILQEGNIDTYFSQRKIDRIFGWCGEPVDARRKRWWDAASRLDEVGLSNLLGSLYFSLFWGLTKGSRRKESILCGPEWTMDVGERRPNE